MSWPASILLRESRGSLLSGSDLTLYLTCRHPIFAAPQLFVPGGLSNSPLDYETMLRLAELLGQHKPPTASRTEIENSGLKIVKAAELPSLLERGQVLSNTTDRCLSKCMGLHQSRTIGADTTP